MPIFVWNTRVLNKQVQRKDLKDQLAKWKLTMVSLVETKVKEGKAFRVRNCFLHNWILANNYSHSPKGRI